MLSNLGLSYALSKNLPQAEATLRRAAAQRGAEPKVRQNLALVVGLQGRFQEAETIATGDLSPDEAAANVAYLRQMLAQQSDVEEGQARLAAARHRPEPGSLSDGSTLRAVCAQRGALAAVGRPAIAITRIAAGPRMTTNSTGRKNRIIGTVSFGGSAGGLLLGLRHAHVAVFLRHHAQRLAERRAVALGLLQRHADRLDAVEVGALGEVLVGLPAVLQIGQLGGGQRQLFGERDRLRADLRR